jgi:hypothetical protein
MITEIKYGARVKNQNGHIYRISEMTGRKLQLVTVCLESFWGTPLAHYIQIPIEQLYEVD